MMFFDPLYYLFVVPGAGVALWARSRVSSAYREASRVPLASGLSGAEAATVLLRSAGVERVRVESVSGDLADYYDRRGEVLRLSPGVHDGRSLAAVGVAVHEAGHALQDARPSPGLIIRAVAVPAAEIGSSVSWMVFLVWAALGIDEFYLAAAALLSANVALQLLNVPVECAASRRAREALRHAGLVGPDEEGLVGRVLDAAAWTHVATALMAAPARIFGLVRSCFPGGRRGGSNRDDRTAQGRPQP
jgi:Zn-dependent membrane protease YugP